MPGNFLGEYEHAPLPIDGRVKQGCWRYAIPTNPPGIDLEQANVIRLPPCLGLPDYFNGFLLAGRVVIPARDIDGKGIHAGFLYADGIHQGGRRVFGPGSQGRKRQYKQQRDDSFHVFCLMICVERNANKQPRRAGQEGA
jgi:hypothetical protein